MAQSSADAASEQYTLNASGGLTQQQFSRDHPLPVLSKYVNAQRDALSEAIVAMNWDICDWVFDFKYPTMKNPSKPQVPNNFLDLLKVIVPPKTSEVLHLVDQNFILSFPEREITTTGTLITASNKGMLLSSIKNSTITVREDSQGNYKLIVTPRDQDGQFELINHTGGPLVYQLNVMYKRPPTGEANQHRHRGSKSGNHGSGTPYGTLTKVQMHVLESDTLDDRGRRMYKYQSKFRWFIEKPITNQSQILTTPNDTNVEWEETGEVEIGETVVVTRPMVQGRGIGVNVIPIANTTPFDSAGLNALV